MRNKFWFDVPSEDFAGIYGALPLGNGYMGMQIEDNVVYERLALNESTIWSGGPYNNNAKGAYKKLEELRAAAFAGERRDFVWGTEFVGMWGGQILEPAGDLMIYLDNLRGTSDYRKEIDLEKGVLTTTFRRENDVIKKEYFANYPSNVICIRYTSDKDRFNLYSEIVAKTSGHMEISGDTMLFHGAASGARGVEGKIKYTVAVKILSDGKTEIKNNRFVVSEASCCTFFLRIASNFISADDLSKNHLEEARLGVENAAKRGFETLLKEHILDFSSLYNRTCLELESLLPDLPFNRLTKEFSRQFDPALVELYFNFNKYLVISSTRNGSQPPALQGIWNDRVSPPWDCKYTVNINLEMNYWSFNALNLCELNGSLLDKMKALAKVGKTAAKEIYNIERGDSWVLHHNTDLWNVCGAIDGCWGLTPVCGAWLINELFYRYEYTLDEAYLKELYPLIKGSVEFFLDFLVPYGNHLVTCPSTSPERTNGELGYVTFGSAHDIQILTELFENYLVALKICGTDEYLKTDVEAALSKFPPVASVGRWGQLKEFYFHDFDFPEDAHRHLAHMYGFYPGRTMYERHREDWNAALKKSLDCRSKPGDWTGWGIAWRIALYARLGDKNKVREMLATFLDRRNGLVLANGFGGLPYEYGSAFQYDCNAAFPAVLTEAFVGSENGRVNLLQALPEGMDTGLLKGVRLRGAFIIEEMRFEKGRLLSLTVFSEKGGFLEVDFNDNSLTLEMSAGERRKIV